ncbi:MAG TPA: hypothetical protein PLZ57_08665 [Pseudobdellovibrionaceae bacterium]|nr:hypothetical protein [Pseudobdellovibrionaceae bacterium]
MLLRRDQSQRLNRTNRKPGQRLRLSIVVAAVLGFSALASVSAHALGYGDPIFVSSTALTQVFPTEEMRIQPDFASQLQMKVSPFRFQLNASEIHSDDPSQAQGAGLVMSAVWTLRQTERAAYGFGLAFAGFSGAGPSLLLVAGSPLEQFTADAKQSGMVAALTANMDLTRAWESWNLPMFIGLSFNHLASQAQADFVSVDRDGLNASMPFGAVNVKRDSKLTGVGLFTGIGSQFKIFDDLLRLTPFAMISVPVQKPQEDIVLSDTRFTSRVPLHDTKPFIPIYGAEVSLPKWGLSFLWTPARLAQGVSVTTMSWTKSWDFPSPSREASTSGEASPASPAAPAGEALTAP